MIAITVPVIVALILGNGILIARADDWNPVNPTNPPSERHGHSMVTLPDGRVMLFGGEGYQGDLKDDLFAYDANGWNNIVPANAPPPKRKEHQAWTMGSKMFVYGGYGENGALNDMCTYDTESNEWYEPVVGSKPPARSGHATIKQSDGSILILGGQDSAGNKLNDFWRYSSGSFQQLENCPRAYSNHIAHMIDHDLLFVFGEPGIIAYYQFSAGMWDLLSGGPPLSGYASSAIAQNAQGQNIIFVFGGKTASGDESDVVYEFNTVTGELTQRAEKMPYPLANGAVAVAMLDVAPSVSFVRKMLYPLANGAVAEYNSWLLFGGISNGSPINTTLQSSSVAPDLSPSTKRVNPDTASAGQVVTYTVRMVNSGWLNATASFTDTLPATLLLQGSPIASSGNAPDVDGQTITWSGTVTNSTVVTITYSTLLTSTDTITPTVVNAAQIDDGTGNVYTRRASVNGYEVFLPLVLRNR
ncbi:MAG: hypothetical protein KJ638_13220 [Chloroflexi bacterium]|nr:hypothetical protein [Chloroflexota bacterium]